MEIQDPQNPDGIEDTTLRTRSGYAVVDSVRSFKVALEQSGSVAAGKSLHYTADLVCSGCFELWQRLLFEYALDHVGIASPRIFWFLQRRFKDLETAWAKIPSEQFYKTVEYQKAMAEALLVLRSCPRRPALKMPKVAIECHNDEWVRGATGYAPSSAAVGRVYRGSHDLAILRRIGDEFAKCCSDGNTEKALFWMKWLYEEDARMKKENGGSLTTMERGPSLWSNKQRTHIGFFLVALLAEIYKDLAGKTGMRMHEEFQSILQLYSIPDKKLTARRRMELLCLAIQICCEVPRWKVPAAPALVKDPVALERAISHAESFFREVLAYEPPPGEVVKEAKKGATGRQQNVKQKVLSGKQRKQQEIDNQLAAYDSAIEQFFGTKLG